MILYPWHKVTHSRTYGWRFRAAQESLRYDTLEYHVPLIKTHQWATRITIAQVDIISSSTDVHLAGGVVLDTLRIRQNLKVSSALPVLIVL